MTSPIALQSNRLVRFESFETYFGGRIFKNFLLFSYIGLFYLYKWSFLNVT